MKIIGICYYANVVKEEKNNQIFFLKSCVIEAIKPGVRKKNVNQQILGCCKKKEGVLVITENFLQNRKINLNLVNVQKFFEKLCLKS